MVGFLSKDTFIIYPIQKGSFSESAFYANFASKSTFLRNGIVNIARAFIIAGEISFEEIIALRLIYVVRLTV